MTQRDRQPHPPPEAPKDDVDEASDESFPASDPPANQPLHPGAPGVHPDKPKTPVKKQPAPGAHQA